MPTRWLRAQVALANDTAEARDVAVNTFHFSCSGVGTEAQEHADILAALTGFYQAIDTHFSANLSTTARLKLYDLEDVPPRAPIDDDLFTIAPNAGAPTIPNEVACCLSFRRAYTSGVSRRRSRGRIYLGPLDSSIIGDSTGDVRPTSTFRSAVTAAVDAWLFPVPAPNSSSVIEWCVFSRSDALGLAVGEAPPADEPTYTAAQLADGFHQIDVAWVDDAFDTQRRRGLRATTRTEVLA